MALLAPEGVLMPKRIYCSKNADRAKNLRRNMTKQERHLWYDFLSAYHIRFYKQRPIGGYIVDFYCSSAKLVVELDGGQHYSEEGIHYDKERDDYLESLGLKVIRFTDRDIEQNFAGVCELIQRECEKAEGEPLPAPEGATFP